MRSVPRSLVATALAVALAGAAVPAAAAAPLAEYGAQIPPGTAVVEVTAEEGADPIDRSAHWESPADEMLISHRVLDGEASIVVDVFTRDERGNQPLIQLFSGDSKPLRKGTYRGSYNPATAPDEPGVLVIEDGISCYGTASSFTISRIARNREGRLSRLEATVEARCGRADAPAMRARISYRA
jgi:hypothetical protein